MRRKSGGARKQAHGTARQFDSPAWLVHYSNGKTVTASVTRRQRRILAALPLIWTELLKDEVGRLGMSRIELRINGNAVSADVEDRTLLVHLLRDSLNLTGTHVGCDTSQCGACVVHIDGRAVKSCTVLAGQAVGSSVTTIEGIAKGDVLHPMQAAFRDNHGLQCGYCTPGMIMSAIDIVRRHGGKLDEATVRLELEGNICRCTGYHNIVKAVLDAAGRMNVAQAAE
jgi:aerobic carbon-monoxide dehydrogenase small subunit